MELHARGRLLFDHRHPQPALRRNTRADQPGETRSDYYDIETVRQCRGSRTGISNSNPTAKKIRMVAMPAR